MSQPMVTLRISAHPLREEQEQRIEDPLTEIVSVEQVVNSMPGIKHAVEDFARRNRSIGIGSITVVQVRNA